MTVRFSIQKFLLTISPLSLIFTSPAYAAEIEVASRVDSVIVYPDSATVTRKMDLDIPAGANDLVVRDLPADIDPDSLRIEGSATAKLAIGSVETRTSAATERGWFTRAFAEDTQRFDDQEHARTVHPRIRGRHGDDCSTSVKSAGSPTHTRKMNCRFHDSPVHPRIRGRHSAHT